MGDLQRRRVKVVVLGLSIIYLGLMSRLSYLQLIKYPALSSKARTQHFFKVRLEPRRGDILDSRGQALALSLDKCSIYVHPHKLKDKLKAADLLSKVLALDKETCLTKLSGEAPFVWLKRKADREEYESVKRLKLEGVGFIEEARRYYPQTSLGANVLGFVGLDNQGLEAIEKRFNSLLAGFPGEYLVERDARGREISSYIVRMIKPVEGGSIYLTIDSVIQNIAEEKLAETIRKARARAGVAIVMDPRSGAILAMASSPTFDPNNFGQFSQPSYRNLGTSLVFEPGSTFKSITAAAALETNTFKPEDRIYCENGAVRVANYIIHDHEPYGWLSFSQAIEKSSNIGLLKVGQKVGSDNLYNIIRAFGFGRETGLEISGEEKGIVPGLRSWKPINTATISFGQGIAVTPLQMVCAYAAIANGGVWNRPYLVKEVIGPEGIPLKKSFSAEGKRVISIETSFRLRDILRRVVEDGTGRGAKIEGIDIAGKTGTAQKISSGGGYLAGKYVASFLGFFPVDTPRVLIAVFVDEPGGVYYGGVVAAPCFREMAKEIYAYLRLGEPLERIYMSSSLVPLSTITD